MRRGATPGGAGNAKVDSSATAEILAMASAAGQAPAPADAGKAGGGPASAPGIGGGGAPGMPGRRGRDEVPGANAGNGANPFADAGLPPGPGRFRDRDEGNVGVGIRPPGGTSAPGDFHSPSKAVTSFLNALKNKDVERLAEATALRVQTKEAKDGPMKTTLTAIVLQNVAAEDLDELATKLEGMNIVGQNVPTSTARVGVTVGKMDRNHAVTRTITVRKEKGGWKVLDISGLRDMEAAASGRSSLTRRKRN